MIGTYVCMYHCASMHCFPFLHVRMFQIYPCRHTYHDVLCVSVCELEIDAVAADILNPNVEHNASSKNPGISDLWEEERKRRERLHCDQEDLTPPLSAGMSNQNSPCYRSR